MALRIACAAIAGHAWLAAGQATSPGVLETCFNVIVAEVSMEEAVGIKAECKHCENEDDAEGCRKQCEFNGFMVAAGPEDHAKFDKCVREGHEKCIEDVRAKLSEDERAMAKKECEHMEDAESKRSCEVDMILRTAGAEGYMKEEECMHGTHEDPAGQGEIPDGVGEGGVDGVGGEAQGLQEMCIASIRATVDEQQIHDLFHSCKECELNGEFAHDCRRECLRMGFLSIAGAEGWEDFERCFNQGFDRCLESVAATMDKAKRQDAVKKQCGFCKDAAKEDREQCKRQCKFDVIMEAAGDGGYDKFDRCIQGQEQEGIPGIEEQCFARIVADVTPLTRLEIEDTCDKECAGHETEGDCQKHCNVYHVLDAAGAYGEFETCMQEGHLTCVEESVEPMFPDAAAEAKKQCNQTHNETQNTMNETMRRRCEADHVMGAAGPDGWEAFDECFFGIHRGAAEHGGDREDDDFGELPDDLDEGDLGGEGGAEDKCLQPLIAKLDPNQVVDILSHCDWCDDAAGDRAPEACRLECKMQGVLEASDRKGQAAFETCIKKRFQKCVEDVSKSEKVDTKQWKKDVKAQCDECGGDEDCRMHCGFMVLMAATGAEGAHEFDKCMVGGHNTKFALLPNGAASLLPGATAPGGLPALFIGAVFASAALGAFVGLAFARRHNRRVALELSQGSQALPLNAAGAP
mmetsp:Transcript_66891/g.193714  ORF Transcript_66891/g.193714 Transcript_66891/m.193714 type:complete len:689 (-) Transcript_66891:52-2118(-)